MAERLDTEVRREQILQAAMDIVRKKGLRNLRIPDVANRVGLVPSAFYRHFSGKQELVLALVGRIRAMLENHLVVSGKETADPLERLKVIMERHLGVMRESPVMPLIVLSEDAAFGDAKMRRLILDIHRFLREAVAGLVEEAKAAGLMPDDTDSDAAAMVYVSLIQHTALLLAISGGKVDLGQKAKDAWREFVRGDGA
jgi:AcrR family transcriptional regulator